ncbi:MAG: LamG-like jellyroll fold domain-containing protein, partial [Patescibacteria group bacterium]
NDSAGASGYYFSVIKISDLTEVGNSDWQTGDNTWDVTNLLPYIEYRVSVKYRNSNSVETSVISYDFRTLDIVPLVPAITSVTSTLPTNLNLILSPDGNVTSSITFLIHDSIDNKYLQADGTWGVGEVWHTYDALGVEVGTSTTGLLPNTQHTIEAKAKSGSGEITAYGSSLATYTLANTPSAPTLIASSTTVLNLVINPNSNPASTAYFICQTTDNSSCSADGYVQVGGTLGASVIWGTYAYWGGTLGVDISGLLTNASYKFLTEARNGNNIETALSSVSSETYTHTTVPTGVAAAKDNVNNTSQINVFWDTSSSTAYQVGYDTATWLTNPTNSTAWDAPLYSYISGLTANTSYYFRVRARNGNSSTTEWSSEVTASTDVTVACTSNCGSGSDTNPVVVLTGSLVINTNDVSTTERTVSLALTTNGTGYYGPVEAVYNPTNQTFSACDFAGQQSHTISASAQVTFALSSATGTKKICIKYINSAGTTLEATDEIILSPVIEVMNGTIMINGDATSTTNRLVSLSLTTNATGYYGPVEANYDSVSQQFSDCDYAQQSITPINISAQTTFTLSSPTGTKKICIKYVSDTGTVLERSANIMLNEVFVDPTKNLLVHLTFDEQNTDGTFDDYSVYNWSTKCSINACPSYIEDGLSGKAAYFDGIDDNLFITRDRRSAPTKFVSMVAWIKPEPTNNTNHEGIYLAGKSLDYEIWLYKTGAVWPGIRNKAVKRVHAISDKNFSFSQWNQVVLTYDGQKVRNFINGVLVKESVQTGLIKNDLYDFRIGGLIETQGGVVDLRYEYHGLVDDLKVYDYTLSAEEILEDFASHSKPSYNGPLSFDFEILKGQFVSDKTNQFVARCNPAIKCPTSVPGKFGQG